MNENKINKVMSLLVKQIVLSIVFISVLICFNGVVYGQITLKIDYCKPEKLVKETKRNLNKYNISLILSDSEIELIYQNDNLVLVDINDSIIEQLRLRRVVLARLYKNNKCFYFPIEIGFGEQSTANNVLIYRMKTEYDLLGMFKIRIRGSSLASQIISFKNGRSMSQSLVLIPCSQYKGEYDKFLF